MAKRVTIEKIFDESNEALVLFEDDSNGFSYKMGISIPEEFIDEAALLDHVATFWPQDVFDQHGKAPEDKHVEAKKLVGVKKNITARVQALENPPPPPDPPGSPV